MKNNYKLIAATRADGGWALTLEGKPLRTPLGVPYLLPTPALAEAVLAEWQAQGENIRKETMPLTRLATIALDLAGIRRKEVIEDMLGYAETDLVCYRASDIAELAAKQEYLLAPVVAWAERRFGIQLLIADGVMPVKQPAENAGRLKDAIFLYSEWRLAALAVATKALGSLALALALIEGKTGAQETFTLSQLEEAYETGKWGEDEEKEARRRATEAEIMNAERFLTLLNVKP